MSARDMTQGRDVRQEIFITFAPNGAMKLPFAVNMT